jgi:nucleotide-binding universal stress UspA family protein
VAVIVWIVEATWPACVDATRNHVATGTDIVLLHVTAQEVPAAAHHAYTGLLGRGHRELDPGARLDQLAATWAQELLDAAAVRLGRSCSRWKRTGLPEREVVAAAEGADLLIVARDGDLTHLGPRSLGPVSRFVVDHAACPVLLVWPQTATDLTTIPPPPHDHP